MLYKVQKEVNNLKALMAKQEGLLNYAEAHELASQEQRGKAQAAYQPFPNTTSVGSESRPEDDEVEDFDMVETDRLCGRTHFIFSV
jgi:hypothetical protein